VQQADFSAQHFMSFWQQPALESAVQQALLGLQQAACAEQQSFEWAPAPRTVESSKPNPSNEPTNSLEIINNSPITRDSKNDHWAQHVRRNPANWPNNVQKKQRPDAISTATGTGEFAIVDQRATPKERHN
jgi:hypothetical protein